MRTRHWTLALGAVILAACSGYGAPDSVVYGQDTLTLVQPGYAPPATTTSFYLSPQAKFISGSGSNPNVSYVDISTGQYAPLYNAIVSNMKAVGFTNQVGTLPPQGTPDTVGVMVSILKGTVQTYYPGYWCDYWYYYGCYYGWSYGGSYTVGSMIVEMVDLEPQPIGTSNKAPVVWQAAVYGVASTGTNVSRGVTGINQAFAQSPYLAH